MTHNLPRKTTAIPVAATTPDEEDASEAVDAEAEDNARMAKDVFKATILVHCQAMLAIHGASVESIDTRTTNRGDVQSAMTMLAEAAAQTGKLTWPNLHHKQILRVDVRITSTNLLLVIKENLFALRLKPAQKTSVKPSLSFSPKMSWSLSIISLLPFGLSTASLSSFALLSIERLPLRRLAHTTTKTYLTWAQQPCRSSRRSMTRKAVIFSSPSSIVVVLNS
jgi:hypothetical protein